MRRFHPLWVFLIYSAVAARVTFPLILDISRRVPSDPGDPLLNTWILWWNTRALPFTERWWNAPIFFPTNGSLALSEHLAGIALISAPVQWLSGNPQVAYNVAFLLSFPLCGLSAYLLCWRLTRSVDASFVAGLAFGFNPYRIAQLSHIQVLSAYWMPFALLGLHAYVETRRKRWLVLFGCSWLFQALCNGYFLVYFSVLVAVWVLWFARGRREVGEIAVAWILAALPLVPILGKYRAIHGELSLARGLIEIQFFSGDAASLLNASWLLPQWGFLRLRAGAEAELFPGVTVLGLCLGGLLRAAPVRSFRSAGSRLRVGWAVAAAAFGAATFSRLVFGPWPTITLLGFRLPVSRLDELLSLTIVCFFAFIFSSPRFVAAYRRRSPFAFYLLAALLMWLFTLGPVARAMGQRFLYVAPYELLMKLPGVDSLRVPARFWMMAVICLSIAAGLGMCRLAGRIARRRLALLLVATSGILLDGWVHEMPMAVRPPRWALGRLDSPSAVLELPFGAMGPDLRAMYRSMEHGHPLVNGVSGYVPPHYDLLHFLLTSGDVDAFNGLSQWRPLDIVVNERADPGGFWTRFVSSYDRAVPVRSSNGFTLYRLAATAPRLRREDFGASLPIARIRASIDERDVGLLSDGDLKSRWNSGPQVGGEELEVELYAAGRVGAIALSLGPFLKDFPRQLLIDVSADGKNWREAWRGSTGARALAAVIDRPIEAPMIFPLTPDIVQFVRLRQIGSDPVSYWSVAELAALAPKRGQGHFFLNRNNAPGP